MSIDIGIVARHAIDVSRLQGRRFTPQRPVEFLCQSRADAIFSNSSDDALAGNGLYSAETLQSYDRSHPIMALATDQPDRFLSLISQLTPILQDILIQYYLLGRTFSQIGLTLFPRKTENARRILVKTGNRLGLRALAALVACGSVAAIDTLESSSPYRIAWIEASRWQSDFHPRPATLRYPHDLGSFIIVPNGQLRELFAPSWSSGQWSLMAGLGGS